MVTTSAVSATGAANTAPPQSKSSGFSGGDFETFLKMLTTQIKNQDPLNPMEGSEFAVQLATFSGVEQQVKTNDLLEQMSGQLGADSLSTYSDWIGRQVRTTGPVYFGKDPLIMDISPDPTADRVVLVAKDSYGRRISAEDIGKGTGLVEWSGVDANGARLPAGIYSFSLESYRGEKLIQQGNVPTYSTVHEVQRSNGKISFVLDGGATAKLDQIDALAVSGNP
ncbi:flagellar hook capping FlgD N-terminal domain-containing protein [Paracoccus sp. S1E-3]|uniref:flagellar hook capping FlgD N-terminal domain-containing protein n=1 Tax=Paracoccus sp. S1E-3 TaxID=2756130 RepID=UPI0015EFA5CD|nr:flagellar hook capping FlgD N-terminal domain-containing protein [Paracoccus sp. S1E-3]MBA4492296.1 flagellar basal body rod modification protein [Paracoccus sp. S1E-3]